MLTADKNTRLTTVGQGTPAGNLLRCYWHPIALAEELDAKPRPVCVLGEDLVLYRGASGEPHLVGRHCPHRGTSLAEGRIEGDNLRCCYHGWLFDGTGQCREQPGERPGQSFADRVRIPAYPVQQRYGMIWAYLGAGTPPALPPYDILAREDGVQRVARVKADCNYFQILENDVDPVHTAILHTDTDLAQAYQEIPDFECEETEAGMRTIAWRPSSGYRRKVEFAFPTLGRVTLPFMKPIVQMGVWATPNDDVSCTLYFSWFLPVGPDEEARRDELVARMERHMFEMTPQDRLTLSSLVVDQDLYACASQGPIVDRSVETLGGSDRAVLMLRRAFFGAMDMVERGETPPGVVHEEPAACIAFDKVA